MKHYPIPVMPLACGAFAVMLATIFFTAPTSAQTRLMLGVGATIPNGDYRDQTTYGNHAMAALQIGVPAFPLSARFDGLYHRVGAKPGTANNETIVAGKVSAVFAIGLPVGPGLYLLGGLGRYRATKGSSTNAVSHGGVHAGLGARFRLLGIGLFAEGQLVQRSLSSEQTARHLTLSAGLEF